jgi:hypothetical protein
MNFDQDRINNSGTACIYESNNISCDTGVALKYIGTRRVNPPLYWQRMAHSISRFGPSLCQYNGSCLQPGKKDLDQHKYRK